MGVYYLFADILVNGVSESIYFTAHTEGKPYTMSIIQRITEADSTYTYQIFSFLYYFADFLVNGIAESFY